ncbi:transketolase-like TK C-terminal-containing protein, partial [Snodgrassella gandavensis]|uniref:transketolase-like TK C-terminal-containing protein n=1 Tax=Snodgrassella gandavensis TaxID=2946698 RepID=UPI0023B30979
WADAVAADNHPSCLIFSRQGLPFIPRDSQQLANIRRGGYVLKAASEKSAQAVLIATGSEVELAINAQTKLAEQGIATHVVSMPNTHIFDQQDKTYRDSVLPAGLPRIAIEAGVSDSWYKYVGSDGAIIGINRFGESAPAEQLFQEFGFTVDQVVDVVKSVI